MPTFGSRLQHAWNAFFNKDPTPEKYVEFGYSSYSRPDRYQMSYSNKRSIVSAIYNKIAVDASMIAIEHVKTDPDQNGRFLEVIPSNLNEVLTTKANVDQTGKELIRDLIISMFDEGCVALVITKATEDPRLSNTYDVGAARVAKIVQWYPEHVKVNIYNEMTGHHEDRIYPKDCTVIIENPFYLIMNDQNSVLQQLIRKMNLLDYVESRANYGKLDLIIQLPYLIHTPKKQQQAEKRRKQIEQQLNNSDYGIAYTDGTERITQLNRPVENKIWEEVKDLTSMLYNQLGMHQSIFDGTASEQVMINYYTRTIDPVLAAIADAINMKWLTKTARTKGQTIRYFRSPFRLSSARDLSEIGGNLIQSEVVSSNEVRAELGFKPSDDPRADQLLNKNINTVEQSAQTGETPTPETPEVTKEENQNGTNA